MPKDIKTNVVVGAQTKGFEDVQHKMNKLHRGISEALSDQAKGFAEATKNLQTLTTQLERTHRARQKEKLTPEQKAEQQKVAEAKREATKAQRQAERDDEKRRGAFKQGLMQGGLPLPAPFLNRGPGMWRQVAGMGVGKAIAGTANMARGMGAGAMNAAFSGVSGVQQMLQAIPILGGVGAGQLGMMSGYAQQNIQYQRQRIGMLPAMLDFKQLEKARTHSAKIAAAKAAHERTLQKQRDAEGQSQEMGRLADAEHRFQGRADRFKDYRKYARGAGQRRGIARQLGGKNITQYRKDQERLRVEAIRLKEKAAKQAEDIKNMPSGVDILAGDEGIDTLGLKLLGASKGEAEQAATAIAMAGGGTLEELQQQDMVRQGFAAQTMLGAGADVTGAFFKAGRRGGLVGAQGQSGKALTDAIQEGFRMGLSQTEVVTYLQTIAQGIQQFEATGIPVSEKSISGMTQAFSADGAITGTRALRMGQGMSQYAQTMSQRGVKGTMDLLMLNMLGGYQGGGAEELQQAFINMETMQTGLSGANVKNIDTKGKTSDLLRRVIQLGGGGPSGEFVLHKQLQNMGIKMSMREVKLLSKRLRGKELTAEEQKLADVDLERRVAGAGIADDIGKVGLDTMAKTAIGGAAGAAKRQSSLRNQQLAVGAGVTAAIQNLEQSAMNTNKAFKTLVDGPLDNFSKLVMNITNRLNKFMKAMENGDASLWDIFKDEAGAAG